MFYPAPEQLDIVYGHFPYPPGYSTPGRDAHYCLVLAVLKDAQTDEPWVIVAMGTSQNVADLHSGEFLVNQAVSPDPKSGLSKPTKFSLGRQKLAKLPYSNEFFDVHPVRRQSGWSTPKIGLLSQQKYERALKAAGVAANTEQTIQELFTANVGILPPPSDS